MARITKATILATLRKAGIRNPAIRYDGTAPSAEERAQLQAALDEVRRSYRQLEAQLRAVPQPDGDLLAAAEAVLRGDPSCSDVLREAVSVCHKRADMIAAMNSAANVADKFSKRLSRWRYTAGGSGDFSIVGVRVDRIVADSLPDLAKRAAKIKPPKTRGD